jgi:sterol desaturase/sphingolipid hydroxylase (fatty acid hydroxylase superfamily)
MHKRIGGSYWEEHAIQHHAKDRVDINIAITPTQTLIGSLPVYIAGYLLCGWWAVALSIFFALFYSFAWTALHSSIHNLGYTWVTYIPFYKVWRDHHLVHHKHVNKNFGTLFIWTDYLFGTKY